MRADARPDWTFARPLAHAAGATPYIDWFLTRGAGVELAMPDPAHARTAWLKRAIRRALGDAPGQWTPLLKHVLAPAALPGARDEEPAPAPETSEAVEKKVIVGIIDASVAFAQERFRLGGGGSRVDYLWVQGAGHRGGDTAPPFGREFGRREIEAMMRRFGRGRDVVDEDGLYRATGALDMGGSALRALAQRAGHGTAVLDLAAGFAAGHGKSDRPFHLAKERMAIVPESFDLAIVSLPEMLVSDTSGTFTEIFVILGLIRLIDHVETRAAKTGQDFPLVVNISLGLSAGPRDGTSLLDRFITAIAAERPAGRAPIHCVLPAGNFRQSRIHAVLDAPLDEAAPELSWRLAADDPTPSFLEIWSRPLGERPDAWPISLGLSPGIGAPAALLDPVPPDSVHELVGPDGRLLARCYAQWIPVREDRPDDAGRARIVLAVPPTVPLRAGASTVEPGARRLLIGQSGEAGARFWPLDLMVQRDDMIPGFRGGGRQSWLSDPRYVTRDARGVAPVLDMAAPGGGVAHVRRAGTISALATSPDSVVVGGCFADTLRIVGYSGTGAADLGIREADVIAPASVQRLRSRIRAAGSRSGSRIGVAGTSVAAPTMSRELAKAMRPFAERPKLSGVTILRVMGQNAGVPPILPLGEDVTAAERRDGKDWIANQIGPKA